jgi:hypothetical protein
MFDDIMIDQEKPTKTQTPKPTHAYHAERQILDSESELHGYDAQGNENHQKIKKSGKPRIIVCTLAQIRNAFKRSLMGVCGRSNAFVDVFKRRTLVVLYGLERAPIQQTNELIKKQRSIAIQAVTNNQGFTANHAVTNNQGFTPNHAVTSNQGFTANQPISAGLKHRVVCISGYPITNAHSYAQRIGLDNAQIYAYPESVKTYPNAWSICQRLKNDHHDANHQRSDRHDSTTPNSNQISDSEHMSKETDHSRAAKTDQSTKHKIARKGGKHRIDHLLTYMEIISMPASMYSVHPVIALKRISSLIDELRYGHEIRDHERENAYDSGGSFAPTSSVCVVCVNDRHVRGVSRGLAKLRAKEGVAGHASDLWWSSIMNRYLCVCPNVPMYVRMCACVCVCVSCKSKKVWLGTHLNLW